MGREKISIYRGFGADKVLVNDPTKSTKYATSLRWTSIWPKGFAKGSFVVKRRILRQWTIKEAQQIIIRDGQKIVFQGRLDVKKDALNSTSEETTVEFSGLYTVLAQRRMRKRWADRTISRFIEAVPNGPNSQNFSLSSGEDSFTVGFAAGADRYQAPTDYFAVEYRMPTGRLITQISFHWVIENDGEGIRIYTYNPADASTDTVAEEIGFTDDDYSLTLATPSEVIQIRVYADDADYDTADKAIISNLLVRGMDTSAITAYDVITDVLTELASDEISSGFDQIADPGFTLDPFTSDNDGHELGDTIIQRANGYSDSQFRTWGLSVWDEFGTTDKKARAVNVYRDISTYKWVLSLKECRSFSLEKALDETYNYIYVRYTDNGVTKFRTPTDNADLMDATSIARWGRRDFELDIGDATTTTADNYGKRFLAYSKDPLNQAEFVAVGEIRNRQGVYIPVNRVRAGDVVRLLDNGENYFMRQVDYNADAIEISMHPDLPPNQLDVQMIQRTLKVAN